MDTPATADSLTTVYWGTNYAGQTVGLADCSAQGGVSENPLNTGCQLNINSTNNLSKIIVGNSSGFVETINYVTRGGIRNGQIQVYGQGPSGTESGSINLYFLTLGGFIHTLSLTSSSLEWHYDDFEDTTGIISIWWTHSTME